MRWKKAYGENKDGDKWLIPDAVQSAEGYRVIRQKVLREGYRYSAWMPAPELRYPYLKLLDIFNSSEEAKVACDKHFKGSKSASNIPAKSSP